MPPYCISLKSLPPRPSIIKIKLMNKIYLIRIHKHKQKEMETARDRKLWKREKTQCMRHIEWNQIRMCDNREINRTTNSSDYCSLCLWFTIEHFHGNKWFFVFSLEALKNGKDAIQREMSPIFFLEVFINVVHVFAIYAKYFSCKNWFND